MHVLNSFTVAIVTLLGTVTSAAAQPAQIWKFDFGEETAKNGVQPVMADTLYSNERGYGIEGPVTRSPTSRHIATGTPFFFSVKVPEGNYRVTVTTGHRIPATETTVRAELRRLMVENVHTDRNEYTRREFIVNVRRPAIAGGGEVALKSRERTSEWRSWDDRLTLEFGGKLPAVRTIDIEPAADLPTLFIIGDSTVCDQPAEPYASWGQMLTRFFKPTIALANHGESGESYRSSLGAKRFDKIFSQMRSGDYLIMQFGHNDMKAVDEASYAASIREVVAACRAKGGLPIVVSPMERRGFDENGKIRESLRGFPEAAKKTAQELDVPFIDLHSMSKVLYEALGPQKSPLAFALAGGQRDATHHNNYGSYELAKCIVEGIKQSKPDLAKHLFEGLPTFNPAHPDDVDKFALPPSREYTARSPDGN